MIEDLFVSPRRAYVGLPHSRITARPGWWSVLTPGVKGWLNQVGLSVLSAEDADRVIDETLREHEANGASLRWNVTPECTPADFGDRLERRGFVRDPHRAMFKRIAPEDAALTSPSVKVVTADTLRDFSDVMIQGWGSEPEATRAFHRIAFASPAQVLYVAYRDGAPAGAAAAMFFERSVHLAGVVTLPSFRKKGVYRELVNARIAEAARRGLPLVTTQARASTSAPLLERFGFETKYAFDSFTGPTPAR